MEGVEYSEEQILSGIKCGLICPMCKLMFAFPNYDHSKCISPLSKEDVKELLVKGNWKEAIVGLTPRDNILNSYRRDGELSYNLSARTVWINDYLSWALPPTIDQVSMVLDILGTRKVLEIASGAGMWSAILKSAGANIIATDESHSSSYKNHFWINENEVVDNFSYMEVEPLSASDAIIKYKDIAEVLFICWGRLVGERGFGEEDFSKFKGDTIMVIGEVDGCTYEDYITEAIETDNWVRVLKLRIPRWSAINDILRIYRRVVK